MRIKKIIIVMALVLLSMSAVAATLDNAPDSSLFKPFSGNQNPKTLVRSYSSADLPWARSGAITISSAEGSHSIEEDFRNRFGGEVALNGALDGGGLFYSDTNRVLGGYVVWPIITAFGQMVSVSDSLALTVKNIRSFSALDSNLIFNALDDSVSPTDVQQVTDYFRNPLIDYKQNVLIPQSMTLVLAEVVADSGCVPASSDFSVQTKGNFSTDPIHDDYNNPIGVIGNYRLLPIVTGKSVDGVESGTCIQAAWIFVFVPTEGYSETNLYVRLNTSSFHGSSDFVWTGSK